MGGLPLRGDAAGGDRFGCRELHGVVGGHRPPPLDDEYARRTVAERKGMEPDWVIPAHCAGKRSYDVALVGMPGRVVHSVVRSRLTFGGWAG